MKLTPSEEKQIRAQRAAAREHAKLGPEVYDALVVAEQYIAWLNDDTDEELHPGSAAVDDALITLVRYVRAGHP